MLLYALIRVVSGLECFSMALLVFQAALLQV